jgi:hypothetical protein
MSKGTGGEGTETYELTAKYLRNRMIK